jgi:DNA processing protein
MPETILSEKELYELTHYFQKHFLLERASELVAATCISIVTEPGDCMAGALTAALGRTRFLELLIDGFQISKVLEELRRYRTIDSLQELFGDLPGTLSDSRQRWLPRFSKQSLTQTLQRSKQLRLAITLKEDSNWPAGFDDLGFGAPSVIFSQGNEPVLSQLSSGVSIVGSRACTSYGLQVTEKLVAELGFSKRNTVSGGAIGIDSHVHNQSLRNSLPTVAVMAGGLDRKYPSSNSRMFQAILSEGALISELAPGVAPSRWRFLQRNRLIAALTPTTVVVEAGIRSGSIRTAHNAIELDRDLYAVPGPVTSAASAGTNYLIAEGKAKALFDTKLLNSANTEALHYQAGSALQVRAQDALRDLRQATAEQIAKVAGLTQFELGLAIAELKRMNQLTWHQDSSGSLHYALKYAYRA